MKPDDNDLLDSMLKYISEIRHISPEDFPDIDLYMDQVTTCMEKLLASSKRRPDDKVLTKTMINNYAKNNLLPSPDKKRYSRDHMLVLLFIYYFKNLLSISDIQRVLYPVTEKYFQGDPGRDMSYIYNEVFRPAGEKLAELAQVLKKDYEMTQPLFEDADPQDREFLRRFAFICMLSYDVYIRKHLIEAIIDGLPEEEKRQGKPRHKEKAKEKDI